MNPIIKKTFNIISYVLNVCFIVLLIFGWIIVQKNKPEDSATPEKEKEYIKNVIVERERADIPLLVQRYDHVYDIKIDSLVITQNVKPYAGYLVTTWDFDKEYEIPIKERMLRSDGEYYRYERTTRTMYVEISNIEIQENGKVSWNNNWFSAYMNLQD